MRVILPGGVCADWSPDEVAEAMRILTQALLTEATGRPSGLVLAGRFLRYGEISVRLTATEQQIMRLLISREMVEVETLVTAVWGHVEASDNTIRTHCSNISTKLFDAGLSYAVRYAAGMISLENLAVKES